MVVSMLGRWQGMEQLCGSCDGCGGGQCQRHEGGQHSARGHVGELQ